MNGIVATIVSFCVVLITLLVNYTSFANAFSSRGASSYGVYQQQLLPYADASFSAKSCLSTSGRNSISWRRDRTRTFLVSEEDVLEAVEKAEELWAEALEARKRSNELIDKAEAEASSSAGTAKKAENIFQDKTTPITMEELVQVDNAARASLDATTMVNKASEALKESEELEARAEEALKKSEEVLEQHLIDFPDSPFAE